MRLFISYDQSDYPIGFTIVDILRCSGHDPWFDHRLPQKSDWKMASRVAIQQCDVFVIFLSPRSVKSVFCKFEWPLALKLDKPIVPVLLEACDIPEVLREIHYTDFSGGDILFSVAQLLGGLYHSSQEVDGPLSAIPEDPVSTKHPGPAAPSPEPPSPEALSPDLPPQTASQPVPAPQWLPSESTFGSEFSDTFDLLDELGEFDPLFDLPDDPAEEEEPAVGLGDDFREFDDADGVSDTGPVLEFDPIFGDDAQFEPAMSLSELGSDPAPQANHPLPMVPESDAPDAVPYEPETVLIPAGTFIMGSDLDRDILSSEIIVVP